MVLPECYSTSRWDNDCFCFTVIGATSIMINGTRSSPESCQGCLGRDGSADRSQAMFGDRRLIYQACDQVTSS